MGQHSSTCPIYVAQPYGSILVHRHDLSSAPFLDLTVRPHPVILKPIVHLRNRHHLYFLFLFFFFPHQTHSFLILIYYSERHPNEPFQTKFISPRRPVAFYTDSSHASKLRFIRTSASFIQQTWRSSE